MIMWRIGWIDPIEYSFDCMLRMERFQIRLMMENLGSEGKEPMAIALKANPKVAWLFANKCPEMAASVKELADSAPTYSSPEQIREAEITILGGFEDFVIYTTPEIMNEKCDFIHGWKKERLFEICDLNGKVVLDVGSGTGRLAFAAAERAAFVVASEPVDALREYMREELRKIQKRVGITSLYVTHDQSEAMAISDKVIIMRSGKIEQAGTAMEIYARPKNQFVAGFIGKANFVRPDSVLSLSGGKAEVELLGRRMTIDASEECRNGEPCVVMIRPEDIKISPEGKFKARIISKAYFGQYIRHFLDIAGQEIEQMDFTQSNAALQVGDEIAVNLVTDSLRLLPLDDTEET